MICTLDCLHLPTVVLLWAPNLGLFDIFQLLFFFRLRISDTLIYALLTTVFVWALNLGLFDISDCCSFMISDTWHCRLPLGYLRTLNSFLLPIADLLWAPELTKLGYSRLGPLFVFTAAASSLLNWSLRFTKKDRGPLVVSRPMMVGRGWGVLVVIVI